MWLNPKGAQRNSEQKVERNQVSPATARILLHGSNARSVQLVSFSSGISPEAGAAPGQPTVIERITPPSGDT